MVYDSHRPDIPPGRLMEEDLPVEEELIAEEELMMKGFDSSHRPFSRNLMPESRKIETTSVSIHL
jgi:hypothetical protein